MEEFYLLLSSKLQQILVQTLAAKRSWALRKSLAALSAAALAASSCSCFFLLNSSSSWATENLKHQVSANEKIYIISYSYYQQQ
jgi:hypothetical protein